MVYKVNLLNIRPWFHDPAYKRWGTRSFSYEVSQICVNYLKTLVFPKFAKDFLKDETYLAVGIGWNFAEALEALEYFEGVKIKVVEWDKEKVNYLEQYLGNLEAVTILHEDAREMKIIRDEAVKFISFQGVLDLHSLNDVRRIISECCRVLKKDGVIFSPDFDYLEPRGFPLVKIHNFVYQKSGKIRT